MKSFMSCAGSFRFVWLVLAGALSLTLLGGGACPNGEGADAGTPQPPDTTCQLDADCHPGESCEAGLCLRRCSVDDVCDVGQHCAVSGYCEVGCRSSDECEGDTLCSRGACIAGSGSCVSKADCPDGLVCRSNTCAAPPDTCATPEDCPGEQLCNGFTQVCFDPSPSGCNNAGDCVGRQGCEAGCTCDGQHECVVGATCTVESELNDCGVGGLCQQGSCIPTPGCNAQADCDSYGLYCNVGNHICERTSQCNDNNACVSQAPATYCNITQHRCEIPTCLNGGLSCNPGDECNTEGRCVPPAGSECSSNRNCCPDDTDSNQTCASGLIEYCDIPGGQLSGACRQGCRDNNDCNIGAGESCNGLHQCSAQQGGAGGDGDPCQGQEDCQAGFMCGAFTSVCIETCTTEGEICPLTGKTCTKILFVTLCMDGGGGLPSFDAAMGSDI